MNTKEFKLWFKGITDSTHPTNIPSFETWKKIIKEVENIEVPEDSGPDKGSEPGTSGPAQESVARLQDVSKFLDDIFGKTPTVPDRPSKWPKMDIPTYPYGAYPSEVFDVSIEELMSLLLKPPSALDPKPPVH